MGIRRRPLALGLGGVMWTAGVACLGWYALGRHSPTSNEVTRVLNARDDDSPVGRHEVTHTELALSTVRPASDLWGYLCHQERYVELELPGLRLDYGDPVFLRGIGGQWKEVGYVTAVDDEKVATRATVLLYYQVQTGDSADSFVSADHPLVVTPWSYHASQGGIAEVIQMMLPEERRRRLEQLIRNAIDVHAEELTIAMAPVLVSSLDKSLPVIERGLISAIHRHRKEIELLGDRYEQAVLREKLAPLLRDEVFPIVKFHGQPLVEKIGRQLWDRASLWRFGWRALYDRTPLPERDLLRREWERFVEQEAIPVIEGHTSEMIDVQRKIFIDVARNENVRREMRELAGSIISDAELRRLVTSILRESIIDNQDLRDVWVAQWQSDEAKVAMKLAVDRLEPLVRRIGDEIFGTRDQGISPSFARVLRNQILGKDRRWLVVGDSSVLSLPSGGECIPVMLSNQWEPFPLVHMAADEK